MSVNSNFNLSSRECDYKGAVLYGYEYPQLIICDFVLYIIRLYFEECLLCAFSSLGEILIFL